MNFTWRSAPVRVVHKEICSLCREEIFKTSKRYLRKPRTWNVNLGKSVQLDCTHRFHYCCIQRWFNVRAKQDCPKCQTISTLPFPSFVSKKVQWHDLSFRTETAVPSKIAQKSDIVLRVEY